MTLPHKRGPGAGGQHKSGRTARARAAVPAAAPPQAAPPSLPPEPAPKSMPTEPERDTGRRTSRRTAGKLASGPNRFLDFLKAMARGDSRAAVLEAANATYTVAVPAETGEEEGPLFQAGPGGVSVHEGEEEGKADPAIQPFISQWLGVMATQNATPIFAQAHAYVDAYTQERADPEVSCVREELLALARTHAFASPHHTKRASTDHTKSAPDSSGAEGSVEPIARGELLSQPVPPVLAGMLANVHAGLAANRALITGVCTLPAIPLDDTAVSYLREVESDKRHSAAKRLQPWQIMTLKGWLKDHFHHPYPTPAEKQQLCTQLGLSKQQLVNWFNNTRNRLWAPMANGGSGPDDVMPVDPLQCSVPAKARRGEAMPKRAKTGGKEDMGCLDSLFDDGGGMEEE